MASKVKLYKKFLNYIFYLLLLALNSLAFVCGGKDSLFDYIVSMLIMLDAGSLTALIFSTFVKDVSSIFWVICYCVLGHLVAMFILIKVFDEHKYLVLLTCSLSLGIYETMNNNAL